MKNKGCLVGISVFLVIIISCIAFGGLMLSQRNHAVGLEEQISAQHVANKSTYDNMWKKFKEVAQVTDKQAEHFKEVYTEMITGRYQDGDTLMKMVTESNPQLSPEVYTQLQREISAGRDTFDKSQKRIADLIREYNTYIRRNFIMAAITGRTPMDANDFVVTSERTSEAFDTGKDDQVNLFD